MISFLLIILTGVIRPLTGGNNDPAYHFEGAAYHLIKSSFVIAHFIALPHRIARALYKRK